MGLGERDPDAANTSLAAVKHSTRTKTTSSQTTVGRRGFSPPPLPSPNSPKPPPLVPPSVFLLMAGDEMFRWPSKGEVRSALTCIPDGLLEGFASLPPSLKYVPHCSSTEELGKAQQESGRQMDDQINRKRGEVGRGARGMCRLIHRQRGIKMSGSPSNAIAW